MTAAPTCPQHGRNCTHPVPAPAYLDPLHDELDRLRTENRRLSDHLSNATVAARAGAVAEIMLEQAESRVDQLTDQLTLANDTLRRRGDAVNATGTSNDALRAKVARVEKVAVDCERMGRTSIDAANREWLTAFATTLRAALADQEPARD